VKILKPSSRLLRGDPGSYRPAIGPKKEFNSTKPHQGTKPEEPIAAAHAACFSKALRQRWLRARPSSGEDPHCSKDTFRSVPGASRFSPQDNWTLTAILDQTAIAIERSSASLSGRLL
jgi:hypothetical protein